MPHERDKKHVPPVPHRGAPVDEIRPAGEKKPAKPPREVVHQHERMDGEGGGSAPLQDAPKDGDLRVPQGRGRDASPDASQMRVRDDASPWQPRRPRDEDDE